MRALFTWFLLADGPVMNVELLVVPDCPHQIDTEAQLRQALHDVGLSQIPSVTTTISSEIQARLHGLVSSPAIVIDGIDRFASAGQAPSLSCRIYPNSDGPSGIPDLRDLRRALKEAAYRNLQTTGSA